MITQADDALVIVIVPAGAALMAPIGRPVPLGTRPLGCGLFTRHRGRAGSRYRARNWCLFPRLLGSRASSIGR